MTLQDLTLALFAVCNSARIIAYLPQIYKAATDLNGASGVSGMTWSLFLIAHLSTIAHAILNLGDWWLAACFAGNAVCCVAILAVSWWKRRQYSSVRKEIAVSVPSSANSSSSRSLVLGEGGCVQRTACRLRTPQERGSHPTDPQHTPGSSTPRKRRPVTPPRAH